MFQPMPTFFRPIFTNIPVTSQPPSHPDHLRVPTTFASAPHGSHREPALPADIFPNTPTPHRQTLRGTKKPPDNANRHRWHNDVWQVAQRSVAGGTANRCRWNGKLPQVDIFVHHLPRKIATGAFQCRRWQRFLPTCNVPASHLPRKIATGAFQCRRWQRFLPTCNVPACHLPRKSATGAFQRCRWQRFLPTCNVPASHLQRYGLPPTTPRLPTCNGGWDTDGAGEAMPVLGTVTGEVSGSRRRGRG